jgi:integrase
MASIVLLKGKSTRYLAQVRRKGVSVSKTFDMFTEGGRDAAIRWANEQEILIDNGVITKAKQEMPTLREALEKYRKEVSSQKKSARVEGYLIGRIKRENFMDLKLDEVTPRTLADMKNRRLREVGAQNVRHELGLLRHLYKKALTEWELEFKNPFDNFDFPKPPKARTRRLNPQEMNHFLDCLNRYDAGGREFQLFVKWQLETGMRLSESLNMKNRDIDWDNTMVYLPMTKNGHSRNVPIGPDAIAILLQLRLNLRKPFENLTVPVVGRHWRRLVKIAGFSNYHLHDCRREAISRLSEQGLVPQEIQKISGHRSLEQLMTYLAVNEQRVVDKLVQLAAE